MLLGRREIHPAFHVSAVEPEKFAIIVFRELMFLERKAVKMEQNFEEVSRIINEKIIQINGSPGLSLAF